MFVEPNLRQMFSRLPGLFVSDQKIPSIYNINYRGLGNPHESEYVAFFQNNIPLAADLFGYPTIYYMPAAQRVERIEFVRGGGGLLYGPQVGPVLNLVTRRADADAETAFSTDQAMGSDGLYSTYNEVNWSQGDIGVLASFDHRSADGPRTNEDYRVNAGYLGIAWEGLQDIRLGFDLDLYQSDSGEAGRLTSQEYATERDLVKSPFNRVEIDQVIATLTYGQQINASSTLDASAWYSSMDRLSRRSAMFTDPANEPDTTAIDEQEFANYGLDLRYALSWGENNVLTAGTTAYLGDSPRTRHVSDDIRSSAQNPEDLAFSQDRVITYNALFFENLFRLGKLSVVPTLRLERINYDLREPVKNASLNRDAIDTEPRDGLLFDLSLFRIDFEDKIEQIQVNISDVERVNSGDSRHQGIEFGVEYNLVADAAYTLKLFANGSLLDTEITRSLEADLIGNSTAFAPDYLIRTGFIVDRGPWNAALTASLVGEQYWQDSNLASGTGASRIDGEIPAYEVLDFSIEYRHRDRWTLYGGVNNLLDQDYYSRVRSDGIEPAQERALYAGFRFEIR